MINNRHYIDSRRPDLMQVSARFDGQNWLTSAVLRTAAGDATDAAEFVTDWPLDRAYFGDALRVHVRELETVTTTPDGSEALRYRVTPRQDYPAEAVRP